MTDAESGQPIPGVNVLLKGTTQGTVTDIEGNYRLAAVPDAVTTLVFSYVGYLTQEAPINNRSAIDVALSADLESLNEVVVIGYGVQEKRDVTTAIASVSPEDLQDQPVSGFDQALAGKMAGVQVAQTSGTPGGGLSIRVRGTSSITAGNEPLYVVDGVPLSNETRSATNLGSNDSGVDRYPDQPINPLNSINVNDIASIEVLKDASAAAIYGSRGSNGVVLITTKQGRDGKTKISYNGYVGVQSVARKIDLLDAYQYAELNYEGHNNSYLDAVPSGSVTDTNEERIARAQALGISPNEGWLVPPEILPYVNGTPGLTNTDWQDEIFRQALIQNHAVSISGGNDNTRYYVSGTYFDQDGVIISSGFKQYSARFNVDINATERLRVGLRFNPSFGQHDRVNSEGPYWDNGVIGSALVYGPLWPVRNEDGSFNFDHNAWGYSQTPFINPVATALLEQDEIDHTRLLGNAYLEYQLLPQLSYRVSFGTDLNFFRRDYYRPSTLENRDIKGPSDPLGISKSDQFMNWLIEHTLSYNQSFGKHTIAGIAGFTAQQERQESTSLEANNFPNDLVQTLNAGQVSTGGSVIEAWSLLSYLGRVQYDFDSRYLFSAALRADGSSRFGPDNKWGLFPSVSAGWRLSEEPFLQNSRLISNLKLRASYGQTGNFQIPNYGSVALITSADYVFGEGDGQITNGLAPDTPGNSDLRWERTSTFDVGVDVGLLEDRLYLEVDYYTSNTTDLLLNVPVPLASGFSTVLQNIGKVNNRGLEVALTAQHQIGDLSLEAKVNVAANKNEVKALGPENEPIIATGGTGRARYVTQVGEPIGSYLTLVQEGVLRDQEAADTQPGFSNSQPGDFAFRDVNGDGEITVDGDAVITGNYIPDYTAGFTGRVGFRNLDFSFVVQAVKGNEIFNLFRRYFYNIEGNMNNYQGALDRWRSPQDTGDGITNRANRFQTGGNFEMSTWHIEDGSFVRVRNITLGYTLPTAISERAKLSQARLYVTAQNPFTFTNYIGYNPEVSSQPDNALAGGEDYGTYPLARTLTIGANLTF